MLTTRMNLPLAVDSFVKDGINRVGVDVLSALNRAEKPVGQLSETVEVIGRPED